MFTELLNGDRRAGEGLKGREGEMTEKSIGTSLGFHLKLKNLKYRITCDCYNQSLWIPEKRQVPR